MTCAACVSRIERVLSRVPGVTSVRVNLATERATVEARTSVPVEALVNAVEKAGYHLTVDEAHDGSSKSQVTSNAELRGRVVLAAILTLPVFVLEMGGHMLPAWHHWVMHQLGRDASWSLQLILTTAVILGPGREIFRQGLRGIVHLSPDMNSLVALGTLSAMGYSVVATLIPSWIPTEQLHVYYEAAAVVITLVLLGRWFEARAKSRTTLAISRLVELAPQTATVRRGESWEEVSTAEVRTEDVLLVKPGAHVPVDARVIEGASHVDESMLTGESMPVAKTTGSPLHAGTVNQSGALTARATAVGSDTVLARIVRLVEEAQASKLPIQAMVDRVTAWFVPLVLAVAVITFGAWFWFGPEPALSLALVNAVSVLIVACPCAMGLATPTSILVGTGRGAELGLLFRQGEALQRLRDTKVVALDKTGTLTLGRPALTEWVEVPGYPEQQILRWASAVEARSEHPIARAVVAAASERGLQTPGAINFQNEVGLGVSGIVEEHEVRVGALRYLAQSRVDVSPLSDEFLALQQRGRTTLGVAVDGQLAAVFAISDPVKPNAQRMVETLTARGIIVAMITGDNARTAQALARELGISEVVAEALPADKVAAVKELTGRGVVAFVGDGVNDAPVLAEADVGIAVGTGTDIAMAAADVVIMRDDLMAIPTAIELSHATLRNIRQNLFWAFAYNAALIPLAAGILYPSFGILFSPVLGASAMAASSVFVVANALRLRGFSAERSHTKQGAES
jgi:heavy metal translocating P-type ATPase